MPPAKLLLFDIDGTLLHTGGAGLAALYRGLIEAFDLPHGPDEMPPVDLAGATDSGLARHLFDHFKIALTPETEEAFYAAYHDNLRANLAGHVATNDGRLLPGIVPLLKTLHHETPHVLGLLTGNIQRGAWAKLEHFEIHGYFAFGAFGDDHHDRNRLGPVAIDRAAAHTGTSFDPADTFIIGDTPKDIACAKACGAIAVAVATGSFTAAQLAGHAPDHLLPDLSDPLAFQNTLGL